MVLSNKIDLSLIQTAYSDKDLRERNLIKQYCKNFNLFICNFHIIKSFKKQLSGKKISKNFIKKQINILRKIFNSESSKEIEGLVESFQYGLREYYNKNWK